MNAQIILALMLSLLPPGKTWYSQTAVAEGSPPPCSAPSLLCKVIYSEKREGWYRAESYEEGLLRYWTIAKAVHAATEGKPFVTRLVLSSMFNESGFRKDVHSGISISDKRYPAGHSLAGQWVETGRGDRGAAYCLGQFNRGKRNDPQMLRLVGTDYDATYRCVSKMAKEYDRANRYCAWHVKGDRVACSFAVYGGRVTLMDSKHVKLRVRDFHRLARTKRTLKPEELAIILPATTGDSVSAAE